MARYAHLLCDRTVLLGFACPISAIKKKVNIYAVLIKASTCLYRSRLKCCCEFVYTDWIELHISHGLWLSFESISCSVFGISEILQGEGGELLNHHALAHWWFICLFTQHFIIPSWEALNRIFPLSGWKHMRFTARECSVITRSVQNMRFWFTHSFRCWPSTCFASNLV